MSEESSDMTSVVGTKEENLRMMIQTMQSNLKMYHKHKENAILRLNNCQGSIFMRMELRADVRRLEKMIALEEKWLQDLSTQLETLESFSSASLQLDNEMIANPVLS